MKTFWLRNVRSSVFDCSTLQDATCAPLVWGAEGSLSARRCVTETVLGHPVVARLVLDRHVMPDPHYAAQRLERPLDEVLDEYGAFFGPELLGVKLPPPAAPGRAAAELADAKAKAEAEAAAKAEADAKAAEEAAIMAQLEAEAAKAAEAEAQAQAAAEAEVPAAAAPEPSSSTETAPVVAETPIEPTPAPRDGAPTSKQKRR